MGADECNVVKVGKYRDDNQAYAEAVKEAEHQYWHDGFNGTISTSDGFVLRKDNPRYGTKKFWKYYNDKMHPIDIHCPGQLLVTLTKLNLMDKYNVQAKKTLVWTIENMQDEKGYFYYQIKKGINSKISYMRWSNAFMFNSISYYLLNEKL